LGKSPTCNSAWNLKHTTKGKRRKKRGTQDEGTKLNGDKDDKRKRESKQDHITEARNRGGSTAREKGTGGKGKATRIFRGATRQSEVTRMTKTRAVPETQWRRGERGSLRRSAIVKHVARGKGRNKVGSGSCPKKRLIGNKAHLPRSWRWG